MNWGDFKSNIINLGFEEDDAFLIKPEHIIQATNRALTLLVNTVEPKEKVHKINNTPTEEEYFSLDLTTITDFSSKTSKTPKLRNANLDFYYEEDTIYIQNIDGEISIFYNAIPTKITINTLDAENIDAKERLIPFLELLTSYYIWLDDDERKAVMYYNQFQEQLQLYLNNSFINTPQATIEGGAVI